MKYHAEFFHAGIVTGKLIPACGSDSVCTLDGRLSSRNMHAIAADECNKRGYLAYQINKGARYTESKPVSRLVNVSGRTGLQTVSERINARAQA
jgi:hypothetical protein